MRSGAAPFAATILAERATIAIDRDDWTEAGVLSDRALRHRAFDSAFEDYWTSALGVRGREPRRVPPRRHRPRARERRARGPAAAAAHVRVARRVGVRVARARAGVHRARRHCRCARGAAAGARHPAATTEPGRAHEAGRGPPRPARLHPQPAASARRRSPRRSSVSSRCSRRTSRSRRSASVCICRVTQSRHRRSRSTRSSVSRRGARRSTACATSVCSTPSRRRAPVPYLHPVGAMRNQPGSGTIASVPDQEGRLRELARREPAPPCGTSLDACGPTRSYG